MAARNGAKKRTNFQALSFWKARATELGLEQIVVNLVKAIMFITAATASLHIVTASVILAPFSLRSASTPRRCSVRKLQTQTITLTVLISVTYINLTLT